MSTPPPSQAGSPAGEPRSADDPDESLSLEPISRQRTGAAAVEAMDSALTTIQPGGGVVMSIELAWGKLRRRYLHAMRPGYVKAMAETRQGNRGSLPFEPVDPRDVKYYRNQDTYWWAEPDDPFAWRDGLPLRTGQWSTTSGRGRPTDNFLRYPPSGF